MTTTKELWYQWYNASSQEEREKLQPLIEKELGYTPKWKDLTEKNPLKKPKTEVKQSTDSVLEKMSVNMPADMNKVISEWNSAFRNSHIAAYAIYKDDFLDKDARIATAGLSQNFTTFYALMKLTDAINNLNDKLSSK